MDASYNHTGTFQLCANNFTPSVVPGGDCSSASFLCTKNPITKDTVYGGGNVSEGLGSCIDLNSYSPERNAAWYKWEAANNGTLAFTINPNFPEDDIDFIVYELINGDCNNKRILRCEASGGYGCHGPTGMSLTATDTMEPPGCGYGQDNFVKYIDMHQGHTYALLVNNWTMAHVGMNNGFTITWGGTGQFAGPITNFNVQANSTCLYDNEIMLTDQTTGALSYQWQFGVDASQAASTLPGPHQINYSSAGLKTIVLTVTGNGGCEVVKFKQVYISDRKVNLGSDTVLCFPHSLELDAGTAFNSYLWNDSSTVQTKTIKTDSLPQGKHAISVKTTDGGCKIYDTIIVNIRKPIVDLGPDTAFCDYDTLILDAGNEFKTYDWFNFGGDSQRFVVRYDHFLTDLIELGVTVTDTFGCPDSDTILLELIPTPEVELGNDTSICNTATLKLDPGPGYDSYRWSNYLTNQSYLIDYKGIPGTIAEYNILVSKRGCYNTDTIKVSFIDCEPIPKKIDIYPNPSDGRFSISVEGYEYLYLELSNPGGKLIWQGRLDNPDLKESLNLLDFRGISPGIYFLKINGDGIKTVEKILVK